MSPVDGEGDMSKNKKSPIKSNMSSAADTFLDSLLSSSSSTQLNKLIKDQVKPNQTINDVLTAASNLLMNEDFTKGVAACFAPLLLELLSRVEAKDDLQKIKLFVCLSKLIGYYDVATQFAYKLFPSSGSSMFPLPLDVYDKKKMDAGEKKMTTSLLEATFSYLWFNPNYSMAAFNYGNVASYLADDNVTNRYLASQIIRVVSNMTSSDYLIWLNELIPSKDDVREVTMNYEHIFHSRLPIKLTGDAKDKIFNYLSENDLSPNVVLVGGVLLSKLVNEDGAEDVIQEDEAEDVVMEDDESSFDTNKTILVPSFKSNLQIIASSIVSNKPVLIQGPVGVGKTTLIEYLAEVTGRVKAPQLTRVQLGDQIDSKMLIGSHVCTEVPGEFVYQPGPLTDAMVNGHWLLFEDIDTAPSDVITVITSAIKTRSLSSLPGSNSLASAHADFRIFFTIRTKDDPRHLVSSASSDDKNIFEISKLCNKVIVSKMPREEICALITSKWPMLASITPAIINTFNLITEDGGGDNVNYKYTGSDRSVSLRDLLKWCCRLSKYFKTSGDKLIAEWAFLDAVDCFIPDPVNRLTKAIEIGTYLNINKTEAEALIKFGRSEPKVSKDCISFGRVELFKRKNISRSERMELVSKTFAFTQSSLSLTEKISASVNANEAVLLVGETGTGKTSTIQYLASQLGHQLKVINLNQQSDSSDLIGGFKPVDFSIIIQPLINDLYELINVTFNESNQFFNKMKSLLDSKKFKDVIDIIVGVVDNKINSVVDKKKMKKEEKVDLKKKWNNLKITATELASKWKITSNDCKSLIGFNFIEGQLIDSMKRGHWILLDEINLAESEVLQSLATILDTKANEDVNLIEHNGSSNDSKSSRCIKHENFRIFACMNPATDVGKCNLPLGIRNRFTEYFVDDTLDTSDLKILTKSYLLMANDVLINSIVSFYLNVKQLSSKTLSDTTGHRPHYSLRTLCRALHVTAKDPCNNPMRSLYESFCLSFLTQLDCKSRLLVENLIGNIVNSTGVNVKSVTNKDIVKPKGGAKDGAIDDFIMIENFWIRKGSSEPKIDEKYIMTSTIKKNLKDLTRIVSIGSNKFPVLIQGETSVGKTSLINYLAKASGNTVYRINNHEHTDLSEYIGTYVTDDKTGHLVFKEGILIQAMRNGDWIILDELNLASTEVLEALNRVLDDNREFFIPEVSRLVKAHPNFTLFATQNPPGVYGGRKILSRAFRNRFIELHFDEIPKDELITILEKRCDIPKSYCKKMVNSMAELQLKRRGSNIFAGKSGFITLRDLFRWGERYRLSKDDITDTFYDWNHHLALIGFMIIGGKVRKEDEANEIIAILEKNFLKKGQFLNHEKYFNDVHLKIFENVNLIGTPFQHIVWTKEMKKLSVLLWNSLKYNEPVLLVGETGCGKTTICQLYSFLMNKNCIRIINCHMASEGSDFLGSLRPVRHSQDEDANLDAEAEKDAKPKDQLFEWIDGPLVVSMQEGSIFLIDEISLADDSVLERLNSVLEPERKLLLSEKGSSINNEDLIITAVDGFKLVATMNPGGDYGKKELSPALRNRFTEIWSPSTTDADGMDAIIRNNLNVKNIDANHVSNVIINFIFWFKESVSMTTGCSIRDILTWINFINVTTSNELRPLSVFEAIKHGAYLTFIDSVTSDNNLTKRCSHKLNELIGSNEGAKERRLNKRAKDNLLNNYFGFDPFFIEKNANVSVELKSNYVFNASGVQVNTVKILRGMQLNKPILLEGPPGVGKTSLIESIAKSSGHLIVRINLSEQTDISDLFGSDLPVETPETSSADKKESSKQADGSFAWRDGPLLTALKTPNTWILLDELNLASQSVLEGLNSVLDHRGTIYISELSRSFDVSKYGTRIFATQNPLSGGGSRKGLPKSFLNRFTNVYINKLCDDDLKFITASSFGSSFALTTDEFNEFGNLTDKLVEFNSKIVEKLENSKSCFGAKGSPFELNLRDIFRVCQLMVKLITPKDEAEDAEVMSIKQALVKSIKLVYLDRFRTDEDKQIVEQLFEETFKFKYEDAPPVVYITPKTIIASNSVYKRSSNETYQVDDSLKLVTKQVNNLSSLITCVDMNWLTILIGPTGSGKTSLVKTLASLSGKELKQLTVSSEMDVIELLGGFEKRDLLRQFVLIEKNIFETIQAKIRKEIEKNSSDQKRTSASVSKMLSHWNEYKSMSSATKDNERDELQVIMKKVELLEKFYPKLSSTELASLKRCVNKMSSSSLSGSFEWIDSQLVTSVVNGNWLLIENANLCPASVLDRLNCLLEPNGTLIMTEQGCLSGTGLRVIKPHEDFRLIFTMDAANGELSRAMRNRGIEIYLSDRIDSKLLEKEQNLKSIIGDATVANVSFDHESIFRLKEHPYIESLYKGDFEFFQMFIFLSLSSNADQEMRFNKLKHLLPETFESFNIQGIDSEIPIDTRLVSTTSSTKTSSTDQWLLNLRVHLFNPKDGSETSKRNLIKRRTLFKQLFQEFKDMITKKSFASVDYQKNVQLFYWIYHVMKCVDHEDVIAMWVLLYQLITSTYQDVNKLTAMNEINETFNTKNIIFRPEWFNNVSKIHGNAKPWFCDWSELKPYEELQGLVKQWLMIDPRKLTKIIAIHEKLSNVFKCLVEDLYHDVEDAYPQLYAIKNSFSDMKTISIEDIHAWRPTVEVTENDRINLAISLFAKEINVSSESFNLIDLRVPLMCDKDSLLNNFVDLFKVFNTHFNYLINPRPPSNKWLYSYSAQSMPPTPAKEDKMVSVITNPIFSMISSKFITNSVQNARFSDETNHQLFQHVSLKMSNSVPFAINQRIDDFIKLVDTSFGPQGFESRLQGETLSAFLIGKSNAYNGCLAAQLLAPIDTIDPIERIITSMEHDKFELKLIDFELKVRNATRLASFHPHAKELLERKSFLNAQTYDYIYRNMLPYRPPISDYQKIRSSVAWFMEHRFESIFDMIKKLDISDASEGDANLASTLLNSSVAIESFAFELLNSYHAYANILHPFITSLLLASHGLKQMASSVSVSIKRVELFGNMESYKEFESFVTDSCNVFYLESTLAPNLIRKFSLISNILDQTPNKQTNMSKLLRSASIEINEDVNLRGRYSMITKLMEHFVISWIHHEEQMKKKREEDESLIKIKNHESELSEEDKDKYDLLQRFPSFADHFSDLTETPSMNNNQQMKKMIDFKTITDDELLQLIKIHEKLINADARNHGDAKNSADAKSSIEPVKTLFKLRSEVLSDILASHGKIMNEINETKLAPLFLMMSASSDDANFNASNFNIYQDAHPAELQNCRKLINSISDKVVNELFKAAPGHVTLKRIMKIIERINSFKKVDPLMKYLTGLELLMETIHEWNNKFASRDLKINELEEELTKLIINWRKLELNCWSNCLNSVLIKVESSELIKFWFHFYHLLNQFIGDAKKDANEKDEEEVITFVNQLKNFMETSNLGSFATRHRILFNFSSFAKSLLDADRSKLCKRLYFAISNLYQFYGQFKVNVDTDHQQSLDPIKKEMKNYVKMVPWVDSKRKVDLNFFSVKSQIEKSHKVINRLIKRYETLLNKPVASLLVIKNYLPDADETLTSSFEFSVSSDEKTLTGVSPQTSKYLKKMNKFTNEIIQKTDANVDANIGVSEMITELIEGIKHYQALQPKEKVDKEKRLKEGHAINLQKRKALSDLLKKLSSNEFIKLSHFKGINYFNQDFNIDTIFTKTGPLASTSTANTPSVDKCNSYFYQVIARFTSFKNAIQSSPSKELTLDMIDRMKGFSGILLKNIITERSLLSNEVSKHLNVKRLQKMVFEGDKNIARYDYESVHEYVEKVVRFENLFNKLISRLKLFSNLDQFADLIKLIETIVGTTIAVPSIKLPVTTSTIEGCKSRTDEIKVRLNNLADCIKDDEDLNFVLNEVESLQSQSPIFDLVMIEDESSNEVIDIVTVRVMKVIEELKSSQSSSLTEVIKSMDVSKMETKLNEFIELINKLMTDNKFEDAKQSLIESEKFLEKYLNIREYFINLMITNQLLIVKLSFVLLGLFTELTLNGFCLPEDIKEQLQEMNDEDAKFNDIQDGGLGDGEGAKDVSNQIESEDQLESSSVAGQEKEETNDEKDDLKAEDDAIEMSEDFESKTIENEEAKDDDESDDETKDDVEDKMGKDVNDETGKETFDEKLWDGPDDDEDDDKLESDDDNPNDGKGEEFGENKMVARDEQKKKKDGKDKNSEAKEEEEMEINEQEPEMDDEYQGERIETNKEQIDAEAKDDANNDLPEEITIDDDDDEKEGQDADEDANSVKDAESDAEEKDDDVNQGDPNEISEIILSDDDDGEDANVTPKDIEEKDEENKDEDANERQESEEKRMNDKRSAKDKPNPDAISSKDAKSKDEAKDERSEMNENDGHDANDGVSDDDQDAGGDANFGRQADDRRGLTADDNDDTSTANQKRRQELNEKSKRSLASEKETNESIKRQKILPSEDNSAKDESSSDKQKRRQHNLYQHIDANESSDDDVIDIADLDDDVNDSSAKASMQVDQVIETEDEVMETDAYEDAKEASQVKESNKMNEAKEGKKRNAEKDLLQETPMEAEDVEQSDAILTEGPSVDKHSSFTFSKTELLTKSMTPSFDWISKLIEIKRSAKDDQTKDAESVLIWNEAINSVQSQIYELCSQLQLVLEPTKKSKLKCDYRNGKRLNMRKVIAYIASNFRKDKIWLKRSKASKRNYQILLALDDSLSMNDTNCRKMAIQSTALLSKSLSLIESGSLGIVSFGDEVNYLHELNEPFSDTSGSRILSNLSFDQKRTRISLLLESVASIFLSNKSSASSDSRDISQLLLVISDGRGIFNEGEDKVKEAIRRLIDVGIFIVFIVLDNVTSSSDGDATADATAKDVAARDAIAKDVGSRKRSIFDHETVQFIDNKVIRSNYMDSFPFPFYIVIRDVSSVPVILGQSLRQWFDLVTSGRQ